MEPLPPDLLVETPSKRNEPRIAFTAVFEAGLIRPGDILHDAGGRHHATVMADGTIALGQIVGSIHKLGALAQGLPACNGWTYWHVTTADGTTPIDTLRVRYRALVAGVLISRPMPLSELCEKLADLLDKAKGPSYTSASLSASTRAQVAQLVEHATENRSVGGSIPPLGTTRASPRPPFGRTANFETDVHYRSARLISCYH